MVYNMISEKNPVYIYEKMTNSFTHNTRAWVHVKDGDWFKQKDYGSNIRLGPSNSSSHAITEKSFRWRASKLWNNLPLELKQSKTLIIFKKSLKIWIKENIQIKATKDQIFNAFKH